MALGQSGWHATRLCQGPPLCVEVARSCVRSNPGAATVNPRRYSTRRLPDGVRCAGCGRMDLTGWRCFEASAAGPVAYNVDASGVPCCVALIHAAIAGGAPRCTSHRGVLLTQFRGFATGCGASMERQRAQPYRRSRLGRCIASRLLQNSKTTLRYPHCSGGSHPLTLRSSA